MGGEEAIICNHIASPQTFSFNIKNVVSLVNINVVTDGELSVSSVC